MNQGRYAPVDVHVVAYSISSDLREDKRWAIARIDEAAFESALTIPPLS